MPTRDAKAPPSRETAAPKAVISRLSLYLRELQHLQRQGHQTTSSGGLGSRIGVTDAQVRKDLAWFGQFGYPGVGYRCGELIGQIKKILGTDRPWRVALLGAGNLGRALLGYRGFAEQGFQIVAAFDSDPAKVGRVIDGVPVHALERLPDAAAEFNIRLAILAVPAASAQEAAGYAAAAGISGLLNFAPVTLSFPGVSTVGVDLAIELEQLAFSVVTQERTNRSPDGD